jgi:hypothetical protein
MRTLISVSLGQAAVRRSVLVFEGSEPPREFERLVDGLLRELQLFEQRGPADGLDVVTEAASVRVAHLEAEPVLVRQHLNRMGRLDVLGEHSEQLLLERLRVLCGQQWRVDQANATLEHLTDLGVQGFHPRKVAPPVDARSGVPARFSAEVQCPVTHAQSVGRAVPPFNRAGARGQGSPRRAPVRSLECKTRPEGRAVQPADEAGFPDWYGLPGSNRRHSPCKGDALPTELSPHVAPGMRPPPRLAPGGLCSVPTAARREAPRWPPAFRGRARRRPGPAACRCGTRAGAPG